MKKLIPHGALEVQRQRCANGGRRSAR
jgi:hypothetical protein